MDLIFRRQLGHAPRVEKPAIHSNARITSTVVVNQNMSRKHIKNLQTVRKIEADQHISGLSESSNDDYIIYKDRQNKKQKLEVC